MTKILTSDILIADVITPYDQNVNAPRLIKEHKLRPGGKKKIELEEFQAISDAMAGQPITIKPGGSSANMLTTLSKLLRGRTQVTFLGVAGNGMYSNMIKSSLQEAGITLIPDDAIPAAEAAVSFIITHPNGERSIATYMGNANAVLKPELVTDELVTNHDVMMVQGSLWERMDKEYADALLRKRWKHGKELWLAMPTHAKFGVEKKDHFQYLIPSANLVLANIGELAHVSGIPEEVSEKDLTPQQKQQVLEALQQSFHKDFEDRYRVPNPDRQMGFITLGEEGAAVVTREEIIYVLPRAPEKIVNTVGAGDTAFAGFAAGYLCGLPPKACGEMAMALAGEKLKINEARLPDPKAALRQAAPHLARMLDQARSEFLVPSK